MTKFVPTWSIVWAHSGKSADMHLGTPNEYPSIAAACNEIDTWLFSDHRYYLIVPSISVECDPMIVNFKTGD